MLAAGQILLFLMKKYKMATGFLLYLAQLKGIKNQYLRLPQSK
jgi:hypothetical protein